MVQCPLGTERKPDQPDWVWLTSAFIVGIVLGSFGRIGAALGFMIPGDAIYSADDLCAEEPVVPDFPTAAQWAGAINKIPDDVIIVWDYVKAVIWQFFWEGHCQCVGLTGCPLYNWTFTASTTGNVSTPPSTTTYLIPNGATHLDFYVSTFTVTGGTWSLAYSLINEAGTLVVGWATICNSATAMPFNPVAVAIDRTNNPRYIQLRYTRSVGTGTLSATTTGTLTFTGPCTEGRAGEFEPEPAGDPVEIPDYPTATCTTIEDLCERLNMIEAILRFTDRSVSWLQTSLAPDSWVPGTPHTGLTGSGSFAVSDTLGVFVTATVPATWGMTYEDPGRLIPAIGSIQWSIDGVPMDSELVHYDEQHIFGAPPATDEIVYNFKMGVVGSVTPLLRFK